MNALSLHTRLIRRGAVYYFRARVPADLLDVYAPKKEIIFSLKTKDHKLALERVRLESVKLDQAFAYARRKLAREAVTMPTIGQPQQASASAPVQLSSVEVERLALLHLHKTLAEDEAARFDGRSPEALQTEREHEAFMRELHESRGLPYMPPPAAPVGLSVVELEAKRARARLFVDAAPAFLATGDTSPVRDAVNRLLAAEGVNIAPESPVYHHLCFAVLKSELKAQEAILRRLDGEWIETPPLVTSAPASSALSPSATVSAATADNPLFSEVWARYIAERNPTDKTARDFGTSVRRFIEVNGDLPVQAISKAHITDIRKLSDPVAAWFTRYRRERGGGRQEGETSPLVFHSFRHTFVSTLLHGESATDRVPVNMVQAVVGHSSDDELGVTSIYAGSWPVTVLLNEAVLKLPWPERFGEPFLKVLAARSPWCCLGR